MKESVELRAVFSGKVQGVGFRWTVLDHAERLHLTGTVKNLSNGKVEVVAQGTQSTLETFVEALKREAGAARIDSVQSTFHKPQSTFSNFRIIH